MNKAYEKYGYNNLYEKENIKKYLTNFDDFMDLLEVRRHFKEHDIGNFYILNGKYWIDQFGQISKVTEGLDELKKFFDIPLVITDYEFRDLMRKYDEKNNAITPEEHDKQIRKLHESGRPYEISISRTMGSASLPDRNTLCPYCGKGWDLSNIDDCLRHSSEWKSYSIKEKDLHGDTLYNFTGQPIEKLWDFFELRSNAIYFPMTEHGVNNPKWIDNTPDPEYDTMTINPNGFYGGRHGKIDKNYILQDGDEVNFQVVECYHKDCNRKMLNTNETKKFNDCFEKAGFDKFIMLPIPNEYCHDIINCTICSDWFNVTTKWGIIKIGWRKRVINIDWSGLLEPTKCNGKKLFSDEKVTVDNDYIHAWGWEKCIEYLTKIKETLQK